MKILPPCSLPGKVHSLALITQSSLIGCTSCIVKSFRSRSSLSLRYDVTSSIKISSGGVFLRNTIFSMKITTQVKLPVTSQVNRVVIFVADPQNRISQKYSPRLDSPSGLLEMRRPQVDSSGLRYRPVNSWCEHDQSTRLMQNYMTLHPGGSPGADRWFL